jgi:hypothetical protein
MHGLLPLALALAVAAPPDDAEQARAVMDKAVQAVGGEAKLAGAGRFTQKAAGKFHGPAGPVAFSGEWTVDLPGQVREAVESEADGMKFQTVKVIAGDKGWFRVNDSVEELDKDALAAARDETYAAWVASLLPLKEKEFTLALLKGESKVGDRPTVGVKVTHADRPDVALFFDAEKGWLLRAEYAVKVGGAKARQEVFYDDYKDVGGLQRPMKTTVKRDGKLLVECEVTEFKALDKADPKAFEKP